MSTTPPHVLIVEDDEDSLQVARFILEYLDVNVESVNDAESAEKILFSQSAPFDLVIVDLALPGKDGWQLLSDIRANAMTTNLKCIAVTAFHRPLLREQALEAGFIDYLPKPINPPNFAEVVSNIVKAKR